MGEAGGTLRPLAGFWFLNVPQFTISPTWRQASFRPLARFWFLNEVKQHGAGRNDSRFRPLAGFLQLSFPRRYGGSGEQREPMGGG